MSIERVREVAAQGLVVFGEHVFKIYKDAAERDFVSPVTRLAGTLGDYTLRLAEIVVPHDESFRHDLPE